MRKSLVWVLLLGMLCMGLAAQAEAATYYVKVDGTGNGSSWATASGDLKAILNTIAVSNDVIYVAAGDYSPGSSGTDTFHLRKDLKVYGGFNPASQGTSSADRDIAKYQTILNGGGTSRRAAVVTGGSGANSTDTVLDGFTITGGNNSGLVGDDGGGMSNTSSSPTITNCTFSGNTATGGGGGMYNDNSSPIITNCTFSGNTATGGGGMYNFTNSSPVVVNTIFWENMATTSGPAIYQDGGTATLKNCVIVSSQVAVGTPVGGTLGIVNQADCVGGDPKIVSVDASLAPVTLRAMSKALLTPLRG